MSRSPRPGGVLSRPKDRDAGERPALAAEKRERGVAEARGSDRRGGMKTKALG